MRKIMVFVLFLTATMVVQARDYKMTIGSSHPPVLPWTIPLKELVVPESNKRLKAKGYAFKAFERFGVGDVARVAVEMANLMGELL